MHKLKVTSRAFGYYQYAKTNPPDIEITIRSTKPIPDQLVFSCLKNPPYHINHSFLLLNRRTGKFSKYFNYGCCEFLKDVNNIDKLYLFFPTKDKAIYRYSGDILSAVCWYSTTKELKAWVKLLRDDFKFPIKVGTAKTFGIGIRDLSGVDYNTGCVEESLITVPIVEIDVTGFKSPGYKALIMLKALRFGGKKRMSTFSYPIYRPILPKSAEASDAIQPYLYKYLRTKFGITPSQAMSFIMAYGNSNSTQEWLSSSNSLAISTDSLLELLAPNKILNGNLVSKTSYIPSFGQRISIAYNTHYSSANVYTKLEQAGKKTIDSVLKQYLDIMIGFQSQNELKTACDNLKTFIKSIITK